MRNLDRRLDALEAAAAVRPAPRAEEGAARQLIEARLAILAAGGTIPPFVGPMKPLTPEGIACKARIMERLDRLRDRTGRG